MNGRYLTNVRPLNYEYKAHQENSTLLEWLEPVSPVVPARQYISWI